MSPRNGPRILLIDDDAEDRALATLVLSRQVPEAEVEEVKDAAGFARALAAGHVDLVVTEQELGWSDGGSILRAVREALPRVPVVAFTSARDAELAVDGMKAGFTDYVFKSSKGYLKLGEATRDALERAKNERLAARSEPWLETILDRANVGVFRSTLDERLIESTPALLRLLGVSSAREVLEIDLPVPYFRRHGSSDLLRGREGEVQLREIEVERPDGTKVWLGLTEVLLLDVEGEIVIDVLVQDVSRLKARQDELERQAVELRRSNAGLNEFASVASHQLQEPLRAMEKYGGLLAEDFRGKLGAKGGELVDSITDGARRMQDLVQDLLAFSRISSEAAAFSACDCNTIVDQAIRQLQAAIEESGAEITRRGLPTVLGDSSQLVQLFQNLLANAVKFRRAESPRVEISAERREGEWVFAVRDNGEGFDPAEAENVFTIFRRLHPQLPGTGIGLTIAQRIVERHGGRIWAESKVGRGSTFYFSLPIEEDGKANGGENLVQRSGSTRRG